MGSGAERAAALAALTFQLGVALGLLAALLAGILGVLFVRRRRTAPGAALPAAGGWTLAWLGLVDLFGLALFFGLAHEVLEGETLPYDRTLELWLHRFDVGPLTLLMRGLTDLASVPGLAILSAVVALIALWQRRWRLAGVWVGLCAGTGLLVTALKLLFARTRPDLFRLLALPHSFSFPSGHATGSSALFGTLALMVAQVRPGWMGRAMAVALLLILGVGASRIYLGVHWPTDVLAGYLLGTLLALNAAVAMGRLAPR
jgi:undecaprenyl-diphosphatase